ncbi:MAG TPA: type II secretion system protein N [Steroidobacteraceae bacterium]|nr:type II secretion system protein N [Steroidobacteraceae bacterium]
MNRGPWIAAAAMTAFVVVLLARFPARWAAGALPRGTTCLQLDGTLWNGRCTEFVAEGTPLGDLGWQAHPLRLLLGKLSLTVSLTRLGDTVRGRVELSPGGAITAQAVHASLPINRRLLSQLPPTVDGALQIDLDSLHWNGKRITAIEGTVDVHGLTVRGESLGDYRVSFPAGPGRPGDEPAGRVQDLGGPLEVQGTLRLMREPGFELDTTIAPRANAPPDIVSALRILGTPDARGRRPFSVQMTL